MKVPGSRPGEGLVRVDDLGAKDSSASTISKEDLPKPLVRMAAAQHRERQMQIKISAVYYLRLDENHKYYCLDDFM